MPKRRRREPRVATGRNTDNRRRRDRDSYSTDTHTLQSEIPTREKRENLGYFEKSGAARELTTNLCCQEALQQTALIRPCAPKIFFLSSSYTLREGGACPGLESRGGVRASNMQCKPKYPKPACLLCLRIASLPEQSAGRLLVLLSVPKSRTMPASS